MDEEKKKRLRKAMEVERAGLPEHNFFGEKTNFDDWTNAIWFLNCGEYEESDFEKYPLLEAVVTDFDTVYSDYFE